MKYSDYDFGDVFIKLVWENEGFVDWSRSFWEEDLAWVMEISLEDLPDWGDLSSWKDFWLKVGRDRSNSRELDRVFTKFYTLSLCIFYGFDVFSLVVTASYQDFIGSAKDMAEAISFGVLWVFYGFVGVDWGVLSLSLDLSLEKFAG